jgi:transcription antitermination factor NusG
MSNNCFPANASQNKKWRVIYTRSNWEKKADALLKQSGLNSFCPIVKQKRKWADRNKIVEVPLFSSYVFVQVNSNEEDRVLQTSGVIGYVRDFGTIAEISAAEIELIRSSVNTYEDIECVNISEIIKGNSVSLNDGVLYDLKGEVLEVQGKQVILLMKGLECGLIAKIKVSSGSIQLTKNLTN